MSFYKEKANSSQEGKKNLLVARVTRELVAPQVNSGSISLTLYLCDHVSLRKQSPSHTMCFFREGGNCIEL